jgi:hypothetical protein
MAKVTGVGIQFDPCTIEFIHILMNYMDEFCIMKVLELGITNANMGKIINQVFY